MARSRLCSYTLALALGLSALGGGAVHLHVLAACAGLVVLSALLACGKTATGGARGSTAELEPPLSSRRTVPRLRQRLLIGACVWFCLTLVCWLQAVPLPLHWLESWAPLSADVWSRALRPFGTPAPEWASLSLAPGRTQIEALKVAMYGLVFALSARIAGRDGLASIAWMLFGCSLAVALVTAGHQVLGAERLYGIYRPLDALVVAPILNNNSLGGYLNLGLCAGLGLLFRGRAGAGTALLSVGLPLIAAEILLSQSRGAVGSFVLGLLLIPSLALLQPRSGKPVSSQRWSIGHQLLALGLLAVGALGLALLATRLSTWHRLADESLQKLDLFEWASRLALGQSAVGIGRGAFGSVFFAYAQVGNNASFDHAENVLLQWASEWGLWVTLLLLLALGYVFRPLVTRAALRTPTRRCVLVGAGVLALQNLVDLGLEIPAVAASLACALGGLLGSLQGSSRQAPPDEARVMAPGRFWLRLGVALNVLALALAYWRGSVPLPQLRQERYAQLAAAPGGRPDSHFWADLRRAILEFPADPYFPLLGSSAALAAGRDPLPWISRALERAPRLSDAHIQLARILKARGAEDQALGALRRAVELDGRKSKLALNMGVAWRVPVQTLHKAVPEGAPGAFLLRLLAQRAEEPATRLAWLEDVVRRAPGDADGHYWLAAELLADLRRGEKAVACGERAVCLTRAREHARRGERAGDPRVAILLAELDVQAGDPHGAERKLRMACTRFAGNAGCDEAVVTLALDNDSPELPASVRSFVASGCSTQEACGRTHLTLGHLFARAGRWNTALGHYEHAAREAPSADTWRALAEVSGRLGHTGIQADAQRRVRLLEAGASRAAGTSAPHAAGALQQERAAELPAPE